MMNGVNSTRSLKELGDGNRRIEVIVESRMAAL